MLGEPEKKHSRPVPGSSSIRKEPGLQPVQEAVEELRRQLGKGAIQQAYRALLSYMMGLRTHFANRYGAHAVSGLYQGYMDMTYFALSPPSLKRRDLKVAIVFNYDAFKFEAWLAARNRKVQRQYWELFRDGGWAGFRVVTPAAGIDSIVECDLTGNFDLGKPDALTSEIEHATNAFIGNVERFLVEQPE